MAAIPKILPYIRVSTNKQDNDNQRFEIAGMLEKEGIPVPPPEVWTEEVISGTKSWKKRKIADVLDALRPGDTLVVADFTRLGRSMLEIMEILSICTQRHINVHAVKNNWRLDGGITGKILAMVFALCAEIERDLISKRTKIALGNKIENGEKVGGRIPYGFSKFKKGEKRNRKGEIVTIWGLKENPEEQEILRQIRMMHDDIYKMWSLRDICDNLNRRGVPTRTGAPWTHGTVRKLLKREK